MVMDAGCDNGGRNPLGRESAGHDEASDGAGAPSGQGAKSGRQTTDMPDPQKLAQDWITLWQSELSAMVADPELREVWQTMIGLWTGMISATLRSPAWARASDQNERMGRPWRSGGHAGTDDAPRAAPPAASPDARDVEIQRLARHVAALEQRLADLERGGDAPVPPKRPARRKPKK